MLDRWTDWCSTFGICVYIFKYHIYIHLFHICTRAMNEFIVNDKWL